MEDYKSQLEEIESQIQEKKEEKIRLEEKKKNLEKEKQDIINELISEYDLTPEKLEENIASLDKEIVSEIEKCQEILA